MSELVRETIQRLRATGVTPDPGPSVEEVTEIERQFGFSFGPEHRVQRA
jgi:hypothetical protein